MRPTYDVEFTPAAERQFAKLPRTARPLVAAAIVALASNPRPQGCSKLTGVENLWRVRVREFRIVYEIVDARLVVTVVRVGSRKDVYRR